MDCGNRAGKREIRQPIFEARLPPSFSALALHQQSVCSIQFAVCHQFWESGMRWVGQVHRNTGGECAVCHASGESGMRWVRQLLRASVRLYAAHPICSHAVQRQIAATVQAVATSSLFMPVMLQARLPPSLPEPSVTCALSSCNCVTCRPSHSPLTYV